MKFVYPNGAPFQEDVSHTAFLGSGKVSPLSLWEAWRHYLGISKVAREMGLGVRVHVNDNATVTIATVPETVVKVYIHADGSMRTELLSIQYEPGHGYPGFASYEEFVAQFGQVAS